MNIDGYVSGYTTIKAYDTVFGEELLDEPEIEEEGETGEDEEDAEGGTSAGSGSDTSTGSGVGGSADAGSGTDTERETDEEAGADRESESDEEAGAGAESESDKEAGDDLDKESNIDTGSEGDASDKVDTNEPEDQDPDQGADQDAGGAKDEPFHEDEGQSEGTKPDTSLDGGSDSDGSGAASSDASDTPDVRGSQDEAKAPENTEMDRPGQERTVQEDRAPEQNDSGRSPSGEGDVGAPEEAASAIGISWNEIVRVTESLASSSNSAAEDENEAKEEEKDSWEEGEGDPFDAEDEAALESKEEEDPFKKVGNLSGRTYNLVALDDEVTVKAFVIPFSKIGLSQEELEEEGHEIRYVIDPLGSAKVVKAPKMVKDEADVVFGVKPQAGYVIQQVTANGEVLEPEETEDKEATATRAKARDNTVYYQIPSVTEAQEVEITLEEEEERMHPAFLQTRKINGVTITVSAEEGILPRGTELEVEEVTQGLKEVIREKIEEDRSKAVGALFVYDINLLLEGEKLDNSWSENGYVQVSFSGSRIQQAFEDGESMEIYSVDDRQAEPLTVAAAKEITAEDLQLETIKLEDVTEKTVKEVSFDAEHFSLYSLADVKAAGDIVEITFDPIPEFGGHWLENGKEINEKKVAFTCETDRKGNKTYKIQNLEDFPSDPTLGRDGVKFAGWVVQGDKSGSAPEEFSKDNDDKITVNKDKNGSNRDFVPVIRAVYQADNVGWNEMPKYPDYDQYTENGFPTVNGYPQGSVYANKDAEWIDYDEGIAKIEVKAGGVPKNEGADVIIVLDKSLSMSPRFYAKQKDERMIPSKQATLRMVDALLGNAEDNNRVGFSSFCRTLGPYSGLQSTASRQKLEDTIYSVDSDGSGTNYEVGLKKAQEFINSRNTAAEKNRRTYVVFLSDGEPNRGDYSGVVENLKQAGVMIYTVYIKGSSTDNKPAEKLKKIASKDKYYEAAGAGGEFNNRINQVLEEITNDIISAGREASFTDVISEEYQPLSAEELNNLNLTNSPGITFTKDEDKDIARIDVGAITAPVDDPRTYHFYVKLKPEHLSQSDEYYTNDDITLSYIDVNNEHKIKPEHEIGKPLLPRNGGAIRIDYYRVNSQGEYLDENGQVVEGNLKNNAKIVRTIDFSNIPLPEESTEAVSYKAYADPSEKAGEEAKHEVTGNVPEGYMLYREGSETDAGVKWVELSGADPVQVVEFKVTTLYTIEKKSISNPPDGQKGYRTGDKITYEITIYNTSPADLGNIAIRDELKLLRGGLKTDAMGKVELVADHSEGVTYDEGTRTFTVDSVLAGREKTFQYTYVVAQEDIGKRIENVATVEGMSTTPVYAETENKRITKQITDTEKLQDDGTYAYHVGNKINYKITVENVSSEELTNLTISDFMTYPDGARVDSENIAVNKLPFGVSWNAQRWVFEIKSIPSRGTVTITYTYTVDKDDFGKTIYNVAALDGAETEKTTAVITGARLEKRVENKKECYLPGDIVTYQITVTNTSSAKLTDLKVKDEINGKGEIIVSNSSVFSWDKEKKVFTIPELAAGKRVVITYNYKVDPDDVGRLKNLATIEGFPNRSEEDIVVGKVDLKKEIVNQAEKEPFQVGDTIQYQIVVTNMGNGTVTGIKIRDDLISGGSDRDITRDIQFLPMAGVDWDPDKKEFAIDQLAGGQQIGIEYRYLVQPEDAGKTISNTAVMNGKDQTVETLIGEIQLSKTAPLYKDNGEEFQPEDRIPYRITVKNVGNAPLTKVKVKDALTVVTGEEENKVEAAATGAVILDEGNTTWGVTGSWSEEEQAYLYIIPALEAGQEAVIAYWYETVPEDAGKTIRNVALCSGKQEETTTSLGKVEVTKTVVNEKTDEEGGFRPGDVIQYQIRVKNSGIVPIAEVEVTDTITTGDEQQASGTVTWDEEKTSAKVRWDEEKQVYVLSSLEAGESAEIYYSYTVVNEDAGRTIINTAVAKGSEDTTTTTIGELELEKRLLSQPTHGDMFAAGDRILYEITVKNTGDTMLIQVPVKDMMANGSSQIRYPAAAGSDPAEDIGPAEGVTWDEENRVFTIARIPVGETVRIVYSYTPTEADEGKTITNLATVDGRETPAVPIVIQNKDLSIVKEILQWQEGKTYSVGEVIPYQITVANTGNAVLKDILVTDQIDGKGELQIQGFGIFGTNFLAQHAVEGNQVRIPELNPGEEVIIRCFYKVNSADNGRTVVNRATAKAEELEKEDKVSAEIKKAYNIYVNHVFANGEEDPNVKLPEDYAILDKEPGYTQSIIGEQVEGYTLFPRGEQNIAIVDQDVAITFVYYMDAIGTDPNHPDGIPDRYQITFQYISEDDNRGIVGGVVKEVHTIYHLTIHPDGFLTVGEIKPAVPSAEVTVDAQGQYLFARWTAEESKEFADVAEIRRTSFTENMVFTAWFNPRSGGGNGGAGGSGGSGGGNGSTSISRVVPEGSDTITIDPEAVPLAMLPGGNGDPNALTNIEDEEVPLFGLPRTGDYGIPLNALIGAMILSLAGAMGILWKREDEER